MVVGNSFCIKFESPIDNFALVKRGSIEIQSMGLQGIDDSEGHIVGDFDGTVDYFNGTLKFWKRRPVAKYNDLVVVVSGSGIYHITNTLTIKNLQKNFSDS